MRYLAFIAFTTFALLLSCGAQASDIDSCLKLKDKDKDITPGGDVISNPDSALVDSCFGSPTFGAYYGRKGFYLDFYYSVIEREISDSVLEKPWLFVREKYQSLKSALETLSRKYGAYKLLPYVPEVVDTNGIATKLFILEFDDYACVDSVLHDFDLISEVEVIGWNSPKFHDGSVGSVGLASQKLVVSPNPAQNVIRVFGCEEAGMDMRIVDETGKIVKEFFYYSQSAVFVDKLPAGSYFLQLDDGRTACFQIVPR